MAPYSEEEKDKLKVELSRQGRNNFNNIGMNYESNEFENYAFLNLLTVEVTEEQWNKIRDAVINNK